MIDMTLQFDELYAMEKQHKYDKIQVQGIFKPEVPTEFWIWDKFAVPV